MNKLKLLLLIILPMLMLQGCTSYKNSIYMGDSEAIQAVENSKYEYRIMPKDELTITISTSDAIASAPFYRKIGQDRTQTNNHQGMQNAKLLDYLVDNNGCIDYPGLGMLHVEGLTTRECEAMMCEELQKYLTEKPNVTVRVSNFKVSILGEVNRPGTYTIEDERITIFQALALAGDMTLFSKRNEVQLLREGADGKLGINKLDLTSADITTSPFYYMQQNDVLYVRPTKNKVHSSIFNSNSTMWTSLVSAAISIASLFIIVYY